jgi:NAD(P)-dependent dehydrogenase (short-subunit alcohol dehydrogenase family)
MLSVFVAPVQATALILAADGASLGLADLNSVELGKVKAEVEALGAKAVTATVDVTNIQQVEDWVKKTHDAFGRLDGAVNAAGVAPGAGKRVHELPESDWASVIVRDFTRVGLGQVLINKLQNVNLNGVMNSMRAELKYLTKGGSVVNIASTSGLFGEALQTPYVASKHGVVGITKVAAKDYGAQASLRHYSSCNKRKLQFLTLHLQGIRVNAICPGAIETPLYNKGLEQGLYTTDVLSTLAPLNRVGKPQEVG